MWRSIDEYFGGGTKQGDDHLHPASNSSCCTIRKMCRCVQTPPQIFQPTYGQTPAGKSEPREEGDIREAITITGRTGRQDHAAQKGQYRFQSLCEDIATRLPQSENSGDNISNGTKNTLPKGGANRLRDSWERHWYWARRTTLGNIVLGVFPSSSEGFEQLYDALASCIPPQFLDAVKTIYSDAPPVRLSQYDRLYDRANFPNPLLGLAKLCYYGAAAICKMFNGGDEDNKSTAATRCLTAATKTRSRNNAQRPYKNFPGTGLHATSRHYPSTFRPSPTTKITTIKKNYGITITPRSAHPQPPR